MVKALVVLLLLAILCPLGRADEQADLDRDGFAVGTEPKRFLLSIYRSDGTPVFVTTDSVIAVYSILARRVIGGLGNGVRESLGPWLIEWDEAVRDGGEGKAGRIARTFSATLRSLCTRPATDLDTEVAAAIRYRLARLRGESVFGTPEPFESGSRDDEVRLAVVWKMGLTTNRDRFFTAVHWITRIELPDSAAGREALALLVATMPGDLRARVSDPFEWIGLARVSFPGAFSLDGVDGPYCAAVAGVGDPSLRAKLWQGSAGLRTLHLRYHVDGKPVLTRGAVFAYREHQTEKWLDDEAWADLIEDGIPKSPPWAR